MCVEYSRVIIDPHRCTGPCSLTHYTGGTLYIPPSPHQHAGFLQGQRESGGQEPIPRWWEAMSAGPHVSWRSKPQSFPLASHGASFTKPKSKIKLVRISRQQSQGVKSQVCTFFWIWGPMGQRWLLACEASLDNCDSDKRKKKKNTELFFVAATVSLLG